MSEISRYCRLLGVKSGATEEELKKAYRDLVQVWHPDRFSANERLKIKAEEQLKEINVGFEYLLANAFQDGVLVEPLERAPPPLPTADEANGDAADVEMPAAGEVRPRKSGVGAVVGLAVVVLLAGGTFFYLRSRPGGSKTVTSSQPPADQIPAAVSARTNAAYTVDLLPTMVPVNGEEMSKGAEGVVLNSNAKTWSRIQTRELISPPFAIRTKIKLSELNDIRFYYGVGRLIFNWEDRPGELCVLSVIHGRNTPVPDRGKLMPDEWHEVVWEITRTSMRILVDGETRFENEGNYAGLKGYPGIGPHIHSLTVGSFVIETPQPLAPASIPVRDHAPPPGDILAALVPEKNVKVTPEPDGLMLTTLANDLENRLRTDQPVHAPFTIRTRAKTDSTNVRLYCGLGRVIYDWEQHPDDLLVWDPVTGKRFQLAGKGLVAPAEWHDFVWDIQPDRMILSVDGEVRFEHKGNYRNLQARPGIGSVWSRVTVDYFVVDRK
jgi:hypothetical protein